MNITNNPKASPPSIEPFNDRNVTSAVCRSTPNGLNELNSQINNCTTTIELNRNNNFVTTTLTLQKDIESMSGTVLDSLIMGDTLFGKFGYRDITSQVKERNIELKTKKDKLVKEVDNNEAIIERSNRDFLDIKSTVPEPQPKKILHFIEDYTLAFLSISYLFMIISVIYVYTSMSDSKLIGFGKVFISSIFLTMFMFMVLFYLT